MGVGRLIKNPITSNQKAVANGVASLDSNAKVPKTQISLTASDVGALSTETDPTVTSYTKTLISNDAVLTAINAASGTISESKIPPSFDEVLSFATFGNFPVTGETAKIYIAENNHRAYRWDGSVYRGLQVAWDNVITKPTTLSGYGIIDAQPLDSDLTTISGLIHLSRNVLISDGMNWTGRQLDASNDFTGTLPIGRGGTGATSFTTGRILFGGGGFGSIPTSTNLFWDNTNRFLGVGASTAPAYTLDVFGTSRISGVSLFTNATSSTSSTTGGAVFSGGVGISGSVYIGGTINGNGSGITNVVLSNKSHSVSNPDTAPEGFSSGDLSLDGGVKGWNLIFFKSSVRPTFGVQLALCDTEDKIMYRRQSSGTWEAWKTVTIS